MSQASRTRTRAEERRAAAQRRIRDRRRRRQARIAGFAALAIALAVGGVWWGVNRSNGASGQALYQFRESDYHSLALDPANPDTVYFGNHAGLQVSRDGGVSWSDTSLTGQDAMGLAAPAGGQRRYAAGHNVFAVSDDGGETWRPQTNNLPGLDLHALAGSPSDPMRVYTSPAGQGFFTSADGGATWSTIAAPPVGGGGMGIVALAVAADDPLHVYAGSSGLAESRDGGQTWTTLQSPPGAVMALATSSSAGGQLYAGTERGVYARVAEGGWRRVALDANGTILALAAAPVLGGDRIVALDDGGNFYRSDDGGATWTS